MAPFRPGVVIQYPAGALESPSKKSVEAATVYDQHAPFARPCLTNRTRTKGLKLITESTGPRTFS